MYPEIKRDSAGTTDPRYRRLAEFTRQVTSVRAAFAVLDRTTLTRA